jgi:5-methyltetrahydrofolate--homocysteine methyltransferase
MEHELRTTTYLAEAFPNTNINLGAGSLALYLGSEPEFRMETVWFGECIHDWSALPRLAIDPENRWWRLHLDLIEEQVRTAAGNYLINIPDLVENIDILSAMRGPQAFCLDLIDNPDAIKEQNVAVQDAWEEAFTGFYEITKEEDGSSSFTAFNVWGPGKTAKVQCDINAMIGPDQFREFVQPELRRQCDWLDYSVFHLDGPDALRHADALMEIESLNCLQWTPGDGNPDCGGERWYPLYDTVRNAGKGLHLSLYDGSPDELWHKADALVRRYGPEGLYLHLPDMPDATAQAWFERAEKRWQ